MVVQTESPAAVESRKGVLRLLLERYPGDHLRNGGRAAPRNEFERYVVRYGVAPTLLGARDLALRHGDERPGDPMIRHDMSTCILCTRCVRACEDIQVVGVLDVAQRGEHAEIIVGADGDPDKAGCTWCGERSEEHTSELQSQSNLVCRLLLEKKKKYEMSHLQPTI